MAHLLPGGYLFAGFGGYIVAKRKTDGIDGIRLDVAEWRVERRYNPAECTHSGCQGAITRRQAGYDYTVELKVWFDGANQPDPLLESGWTVELVLWISHAQKWSDYGFNEQSRYYSPSAIIESIRTIDNSQSRDTDNDVVRQEITLKGNSLMFLLPAENADYVTYMNYLNNKHWMD